MKVGGHRGPGLAMVAVNKMVWVGVVGGTYAGLSAGSFLRDRAWQDGGMVGILHGTQDQNMIDSIPEIKTSKK